MTAQAPEHLATLRKLKLLSQRDLAQKAGISTSTVALLETGRSIPKFVTMRKICEALGLVDPSTVVEFRQAISARDNKSSLSPRSSAPRMTTE